MPDSPNNSPKSRMWSGLFLAALFAYAAFFSIFRHEILGRRGSFSASPEMGFIVGGVQVAISFYFLCTAWAGYRDSKAERRD